MTCRIGLPVLVLVIAACGSPATRIDLGVMASGLTCDHYQLQIDSKSALSDALPDVDVVVADDTAGKQVDVQAWCLSAGVQLGYGTAVVTPVRGDTVHASVVLVAVDCGPMCVEGAVTCDHDGLSTCAQQGNGCVGWSTPVPCAAATPFCSNGACAAQCADECTTGQTQCDGSTAVQTCGQFDSDSCLDWSPPMACAAHQACSAGACMIATVTCAQDGAACDDGNACTTHDTCEGTTCTGTPLCTTAPANADPTCSAGTCGFACHPGFTQVGTGCGAGELVFNTSSTYTGNLGGLGGADASCTMVANAAGHAGTFKAWLSDGTGTAAGRLTHATGPYRLYDGTVVAASWTVLTSGTLTHAIDEDENGHSLVKPAGFPWTDTTTTGTLDDAVQNCANWTSAASTMSGIFGTSEATDPTWTVVSSSTCDLPGGLICIQQ